MGKLGLSPFLNFGTGNWLLATTAHIKKIFNNYSPQAQWILYTTVQFYFQWCQPFAFLWLEGTKWQNQQCSFRPDVAKQHDVSRVRLSSVWHLLDNRNRKLYECFNENLPKTALRIINHAAFIWLVTRDGTRNERTYGGHFHELQISTVSKIVKIELRMQCIF